MHDIDQLRHYNLKPDDEDAVLFGGPFEEAVEEAVRLRMKLEDMSSNTVEDVEAQEALLKEADDQIARLRCATDLLVAAEFWGENAKDKQEKVRHAAVVTGYYVENGPTEEFKEKAEKERRGQRMFHWPLEFPEVIVTRGGFDAFVGNPPFMGGTRIRGNMGLPYLEYLGHSFGKGNRADLCIYFLLRAAQFQHTLGSVGFITTNTVSQGDSREFGLERLAADGFVIHRAVSTRIWPGAASIQVSLVWVCPMDWQGMRFLDDAPVTSISSLLSPEDGVGLQPFALAANKNRSFNGVKVYGQGFLLTEEEANFLIDRDQANSQVIWPYLNGIDLNSRPSHSPSRWAINFYDWPLSRSSAPAGYKGPVAEDFPDCLAIVVDKVKPERTRKKQLQSGEFVYALRKPLPQRWWIYGDKRPALYEALAEKNRALTIAATSRTLAFVMAPTRIVFSHATNVFAFDSFAEFAVLQSCVHEAWARQFASSMKGDLRYTPSDCFETFPFPHASQMKHLSDVGEMYHEFRDSVLFNNQEGLTSIYNRFHESAPVAKDIQELREHHRIMDQAVIAAYGWSDVAIVHDFHETKQGVRFTISEAARREILYRLLKLNHERYEEEKRQGLHDKKTKPKRAAGGKRKAKKVAKPVAAKTLFDMDAEETTFPANDSDKFLCGVLCDLIAVSPGLAPTAYRDALIVLLRFERHSRLLIGDEQSQFVSRCKKIPKNWIQSPQHLPWTDLLDLLTFRKALVHDKGKALRCGSKLDEVRPSYPECDSELVSLVLKAATVLREQQESAMPEPQVLLSDFQEDVASLCGGTQ